MSPARTPVHRPRPAARDLLTFNEAAEYLRVSETTLRLYVHDGRIHPYKLGPKILRFDPRDLDELLTR